MNAVTLEILIHHYYRSEPYETRFQTAVDAPALKLSPVQEDAFHYLETAERLERVGIVTSKEPIYAITEKGKAHVIGLLGTPLPTQKWIAAE